MSDQKETIFEAYGRFKEEHLDAVLKEYGLVSNQDLEKTVSEIIHHLLGSDAKIRICLCEKMGPLALTLNGPNLCMICVNSYESKELLQNEEGRNILYATLAHEIGHIDDTKKTKYHYENTLEWSLDAEIKADQLALVLLKRIFSNPREIMMKQIIRALDKNLNITASQANVDLGVAIYKARRKALLKN